MKVFPPIVSVPVRVVATPFTSTENAVVPLPEPDPPLVTVIQVALLTAVHPHPVAAVTAVEPDPPLAFIASDAGEMVGAQGAPASVTVKVWPAIVSVPLRPVVNVLGSALNATLPAPLPTAPDVTVNHETLLVAVQSQSVAALTAVDPVPPEKGTDCDAGEIVNVQETPVCVALNVCPAIVAVPVRVVVPA